VTSFVIVWFAAYAVASYYKQREVVFFLFLGGAAFIGLGLVAELTLGTFNPTNAAYRFCGTIHPNHQGWNCATLALSGIALAMGSKDRRYRLPYLSGAIMGIVALLLTKSRTSLAAFAIAIVVYGVLVSARRRKGPWLPTALLIFAFIAMICASLAALNETGIAQRVVLLGRDVQEADSLSGRIPLWQSGVAYFYSRPLMGYGFNAFETPERITELQRANGWAAASFHSEYFDLLLGVGCIGAFIYVFIILSGLKRTFVLFKTYPTCYYALEFALIIFYLAIMLLENPGRDPNIPTFVLFVIMARRGLLLESETHLAIAA
jgi:O-antigen ligase